MTNTNPLDINEEITRQITENREEKLQETDAVSTYHKKYWKKHESERGRQGTKSAMWRERKYGQWWDGDARTKERYHWCHYQIKHGPCLSGDRGKCPPTFWSGGKGIICSPTPSVWKFLIVILRYRWACWAPNPYPVLLFIACLFLKLHLKIYNVVCYSHGIVFPQTFNKEGLENCIMSRICYNKMLYLHCGYIPHVTNVFHRLPGCFATWIFHTLLTR